MENLPKPVESKGDSSNVVLGNTRYYIILSKPVQSMGDSSNVVLGNTRFLTLSKPWKAWGILQMLY